MKKTSRALAFIAALLMVGCCTHNKEMRVVPNVPIVVDQVGIIRSETVALVTEDPDGDVTPYCAGVWVAADKILTAEHCSMMQKVKDADEQLASRLDPDVPDVPFYRYSVESDSTGVWKDPRVSRGLKVIKKDAVHDLMLLQTLDQKETPSHPIAVLAIDLPNVGSKVHIMGHPAAINWTYTPGTIAAYRNEESLRLAKNKGPFIQIVGPVWKGNSGGGAFTESGELLGIASFLAPAPSQAFFIHVDTIREFLKLGYFHLDATSLEEAEDVVLIDRFIPDVNGTITDSVNVTNVDLCL